MKVHQTEEFSLKLHEQTFPPTLHFSLKWDFTKHSMAVCTERM